MNCVYKEYDVKIKMVQEQMTTVKNEVFIGLLQENFYLVGGLLPIPQQGKPC